VKLRFNTFLPVLALLVGLGAPAPHARGEVMLQYFNTSWNEITGKMPELAEAGYTALWLPPPFKAGGVLDVGYDTYDRFDYGGKENPINHTIATKYGTAADLLRLMETAHRFGIRVYFDNVMAHNGGPVPGYDQYTPITIQSGFVPEDFHLQARADGSYRTWPDGVDYSNAWQVLYRNPFGIDIAQEDPNGSFGATEGSSFPKYHGIRHPGSPELYPDLDLPIDVVNPATGIHFNVYTFANKEPFQDTGYTDSHGVFHSEAAGNGKFDFEDANGNGKHDAGEACEPFTDTGIDPGNPAHHTAAWGYGNGKYDMGTPVSEDVNSMLFRAVRWFVDQAKPDGFRLDAVKHVPDYFFGKESGSDKDYSDWGYCGQIQTQFNITRGFSDWDNHRDTCFNEELPRDDALLFGEHLGTPPDRGPYLNAGFRIADDDFLNGVKDALSYNLSGLDQSGYGTYGGVNTGVVYCMSHDNNYIWGGHYKLAHALLCTGASPAVIYTDGFHHAGSPNYFPKPSYVPFLGQWSQNFIFNELSINQQFGRGDQIPKWSDQNFAAYERRDKRENALMSDADGTVLLFMMARLGSGGQTRGLVTSFPAGAPLFNYSLDGGGFYAYVQGDGTLKDGGGGAIIVPDGGYFAFSWRNPEQSDLWQPGGGAPITILQSGSAASTLTYLRTDGPDGDANFNPYNVSGAVAGSYSYPMTVPRVTDATNLSFIARADASAENILLKLDGGIDINSQMVLGPQTGELRDHPPALSNDVYLGYEQMQFLTRQYGEKFANKDTTQNKFGSSGAGTYLATSGSYNGGTSGSNNYDTEGGNVAAFLYHDPSVANDHGQLQYSGSGGTVTLWAKTNSVGAGYRMFVYYTGDGTWPEGAGGVGLGTTTAVEMVYDHNQVESGGTNNWWGTSPPITKPGGSDFRYKIGIFKDTTDGVAGHSVGSIFPSDITSIGRKKHGLTTFRVTNFNATTAAFYPHNDYGVRQTGLTEGFHVLRARAFLNRAGRAAIYNTYTQTFYYDALPPQGEVKYPSENDSVGGQQYGVVVRTDPSVTEVWYKIVDSDSNNDDLVTSATNGNNAWVKASQLTPTGSVSSSYPNEWRFNYTNIPAGGSGAQILVRLREISSADSTQFAATATAGDDAAKHYTTLVRHIYTNGPSIHSFIRYPGANETVGGGYVMKVLFSKEIGYGVSNADLLKRFTIGIASSESGSLVNPVLQPAGAPSGFQLNDNLYDQNDIQTDNGPYREINYALPNLYNDDPNFLHTIVVTYTNPGSPTLVSNQSVKAWPTPIITNNIVTPPEFDAQQKAYQIILPDLANPTAVQRSVPIEVVTDADATAESISFTIGNVNPADIVAAPGNPTASGSNLKVWDYTWQNLAAGPYNFTSTVSTPRGNSSVTRNATVVIRQLITTGTKGDTDDDGLTDSIENAAPAALGTTPNNGAVHLWMISGKTDPLNPDSDLDGLSDGLELGWASAIGDTNTGTDTNGDGVPNFQPDLDPPLFNTSDNSAAPAGYDYFNPWPYNANNSSTDQVAGSMTNPNKADTDDDGLNDGLEDRTFQITGSSSGLVYKPVHNGRVDIGITGSSGSMTVIAHPPTFYNSSMVDRSKVLAKSPGAVWFETDPNNGDTDGDGMSDGAEDVNHNGIVDLAIIDRNRTDAGGNFVVLATLDSFSKSVTVQGSGTNATPVTFKYSDFCYTYVEPANGQTYTSTALDKTRLNNVFKPGGLIRGDKLDVIWLEVDPRVFSTSGDGLPDGWKAQHGLDPWDDGVIGHYNLHTGKVIGNALNGPAGDPDGDGFTNLQEYLNNTDPQSPDTGVPPPAGSITVGPGVSSTVGTVVNNHEFTDWTANDLIALDYYDGDGPNNSSGDVYHTYDGFDSSRDLVAFYAHDGGAVSQGGDGNFYFRVDLNDLQAYAESSNLNVFVAVNFGHPGTGEYNLPDEVDTGTVMGWQAVVACYQGNNGRVYLWNQNSATHSTAIGQDLSQFGVVARDQNTANGFKKANFNSSLDAVEFSVSRQALLDAGWNGLDAADLSYQVYTTKDFTGDSPQGSGDIGGRSDIRDSIRNDWIASDYWKDQAYISGAKSVLYSYVGLRGDNDRGKRIKVVSLIHGNQAIQPGSTIQSLINTGTGSGYYRPFDVHQAYNVPLTLHITPTLASAIQWAKADPGSGHPWRDGPALNTRLAGLIDSGTVDLLGSTFSDHMLPYFSKSFNRDNVALANEFLTAIYGHAPSANVFWTPERVSDDGVLDKVNDLGYGYTFIDQMRHGLKWFGRSSAVSSDGYRLNQINGTKCFVINDGLGGYLLQNDDGGLPLLLRQLMQHNARTGPNDQVMVLVNNWEDFANKTYADAYDKNIAWMASHPWIQMVTPDQIASGQIDTSVPPNPASPAGFGAVQRGTGLVLAKVAKDWLDHATEENYNNWYSGSAFEEGLFGKVFNIRSGTALSGSYGQIGSGAGLADSAWNSVAALSGSYGSLAKLARGTAHASVFETAFHDQTANDLGKFSTGTYIYPDTTTQNLAGFSKYAQSQTRTAAVYSKVNAWAAAATSGSYIATAIAESADVDLDGEPEYLLYNDRMFALFERIGGRMTNAWVRDIGTGEVFQTVGNPLGYAGSETEEEGNVHLSATSGQLAYRTSGFKDWFAQTGGAGVGTNSYVNNYYSIAPAAAGIGWTFTSSDGKIAKTITLAPRASRLAAQYNLGSGVNTVYVRHGLSPNLYDLLTSGQANLGSVNDAVNGEASVIDSTAQQRIVRAFVKYGGGYNALYNSAAVDRDNNSGFDTVNMRNQAQIQQLEVSVTNGQTFALAFETGPTVSISTANDGIPDWWKQKYGLSTTDPTVGNQPAASGDGMTNGQKYVLGLDPTVKNANGVKVTVSKNGQGNFVLQFPTLIDRLYQISYTGNLGGSWTAAGSPLNGTGGTATWTDDGSATGSPSNGATHRFYRVGIQHAPAQ
jgi:hypothetical protein